MDEDIHIPIDISRAASFQRGQSIHLIVEIHKDRDQYLNHAFRFVRFPPFIRRNTELEKLRSVAIKIQWLDQDGTWKERYLERTQLWGTMKALSSDILQMYRKGLMVLLDLEQRPYSNAPSWVLSRSPAPIQFLRYDHLSQKLVAENVRSTMAIWPQDNTIATNTARLQKMFPDGDTTIVGPKPHRMWFGRASTARTACDICYSQRTVSLTVQFFPSHFRNPSLTFSARLPPANSMRLMSLARTAGYSTAHAPGLGVLQLSGTTSMVSHSRNWALPLTFRGQ